MRASAGFAVRNIPWSHGVVGGSVAGSRGLATAASVLAARDRFAARHLGPRESDLAEMCATVGVSSLNDLISKTVPKNILLSKELDLGPYSAGLSESDALAELRRLIEPNQVMRSMMGMGYYDCKTPAVILRNVLENPGWYTQYTPYQPEVAQGRLESLMNFQTMVADLTGMEMCNSSLLDEVRARRVPSGRMVGRERSRERGLERPDGAARRARPGEAHAERVQCHGRSGGGGGAHSHKAAGGACVRRHSRAGREVIGARAPSRPADPVTPVRPARAHHSRRPRPRRWR